MLLKLLRQFAAVISNDLDRHYAEEIEAQPGRVFSPKRVHELSVAEAGAPDGLSLDYIRLAILRNDAAWQATEIDTAVTMLAAHVSQQLAHAVLLERHILERLK